MDKDTHARTRDARLKAALKANLARRKAQARARKSGEAGAREPGGTDHDDKTDKTDKSKG